jgi:flagellar biogenesis protein FliO
LSTTTQPNFERGSGEHESEGISLTGLTTVAKNLGQMSIIIAVVALVTRLLKKLTSTRRSSRSPVAAAGN